MSKTKKQKLYNGIMLGILVFSLLGFAVVGVYAILVHFYGNTFKWLPVVAIAILVSMIVERAIYTLNNK